MIDSIKNWDEQLFLFLNQQYISWLDPVMLALTGKFIWVPLYLFLLFVMIREYKTDSIWYIVGLAIVILLADQFTSGFMKPYFERLRPCHDPRWQDVILNYSGCGGLYGFASSHAANTFALAAFFERVGGKRIPEFSWLFFWAAMVSYTRIYLGVHYPGDILTGAIIGILIGWFIFWLTKKLKTLTEQSKAKSNVNNL